MQLKPIIIPIEMCQDALKTKYVRELQVYVWLKMKSSGKIKITPGVLSSIMADLNIKSVKTAKTNIQLLLGKRWITLSRKSGYYFIKGFKRIRELEGFTKRTGAEFNIKDIKNFKGFLVAAVISNLNSRQKIKEWLLVTECKKGAPRQLPANHIFIIRWRIMP